jgi:acetyl-CoA carboxylase biotin carboxyl carrier protein
MTIEEIKELLQIFNESGVGELEVQRGENRVRIRRAAGNPEYTVEPAIPSPAVDPPGKMTAPPKAPVAESENVLVKSPIVGTYYDAPSPEAPPFVRAGDPVEPGQVLCVIESMKLMNEIEAEVAGTVAAKLIENGRPVEYGEALFAIRPR